MTFKLQNGGRSFINLYKRIDDNSEKPKLFKGVFIHQSIPLARHNGLENDEDCPIENGIYVKTVRYEPEWKTLKIV